MVTGVARKCSSQTSLQKFFQSTVIWLVTFNSIVGRLNRSPEPHHLWALPKIGQGMAPPMIDTSMIDTSMIDTSMIDTSIYLAAQILVSTSS